MAESIYESLGVRTVIDAWGTVTALGGSLMAPEVLQAMQSAAGAFVDMSELHTAAGRRIADLLGVEACCVTCGAAAGLAIAAAACMTGTRRSYAYQLPDTTGMKDDARMIWQPDRHVPFPVSMYTKPLSTAGIYWKTSADTPMLPVCP